MCLTWWTVNMLPWVKTLLNTFTFYLYSDDDMGPTVCYIYIYTYSHCALVPSIYSACVCCFWCFTFLPMGMKSLRIAISWLMCRQWWRGCKGNIFGSIQHQRTELTQLGHIWPISPTCNSNFTVSTCRLHNLAIHKWLCFWLLNELLSYI